MSDTTVLALPEGAWIVLGFLLDGAGPRSGYDLQAQAARSVAHFWPVTKAHIYTALTRLEGVALVTSERVEQVGLPDKRVYAPTAEGKAAFEFWLQEADLGTAKLRHPLLVKTFFGAALPPDVFAELLNRHEARCRQGIADYQLLIAAVDARKDGGGGKDAARFRGLAIRHGILSLEADLAWIAEARTGFDTRSHLS